MECHKLILISWIIISRDVSGKCRFVQNYKIKCLFGLKNFWRNLSTWTKTLFPNLKVTWLFLDFGVMEKKSKKLLKNHFTFFRNWFKLFLKKQYYFYQSYSLNKRSRDHFGAMMWWKKSLKKCFLIPLKGFSDDFNFSWQKISTVIQ